MVEDGLGLLLDLRDHRAGIRAERGREDHLHLRLGFADDHLLDQRQLYDVHPDLRIHDLAEGVEDRELLGAALGVERGRGGRLDGCFGDGRLIGHGRLSVVPRDRDGSREA